jgi:hypothetical protein
VAGASSRDGGAPAACGVVVGKPRHEAFFPLMVDGDE